MENPSNHNSIRTDAAPKNLTQSNGAIGATAPAAAAPTKASVHPDNPKTRVLRRGDLVRIAER